MLHRMVSGLLFQGIFVLGNVLAHNVNARFLSFKFSFKIVDPAELVLHVIFHLVNTIGNSCHLSVDSTFQTPDLLQILLSSLNFHGEFSRSRLSIIHLAFLEI